MSRLAKLDMYRKVPGDLLEGSKQGKFISWLTLIIMVLLVYKETVEYASSDITSTLYLDRQPRSTSSDQRDHISVSFNITLMDLSCDFVQVEVVSSLGNQQNVTKWVDKYPINTDGVVQIHSSKRREQQDIALQDAAVTQSLEELHASGESVVLLSDENFEQVLAENDLVFVSFCFRNSGTCNALDATWEVLAIVLHDAKVPHYDVAGSQTGAEGYEEKELEEAKQVDVPVVVAKVDCMMNFDICHTLQNIKAYPTLRLFAKGKQWSHGDYRGQRAILDMVQYLRIAEKELGREGLISLDRVQDGVDKHLTLQADSQQWSDAMERVQQYHTSWNSKEHPGCQVSGSIVMNRAPGNLQLQATSRHHDLAPSMTNVSHEIHHLSFLPSVAQSVRWSDLPPNYWETTKPIDGNAYVTESLHQAYHHYIKLVPNNGPAFQMIPRTQLAMYEGPDVPEAKFIVDLSPIAVRYRRVSRHWYDYVTSLMAILGGMFTVVGFLQSGARYVSRELSRKQSLRKPYP